MSDAGTPAPQDTTPADWEQLDTPSNADIDGRLLEDSGPPSSARAQPKSAKAGDGADAGDAAERGETDRVEDADADANGDAAAAGERPGDPVDEEDDEEEEDSGEMELPPPAGRVRPHPDTSTSTPADSEASDDSGRLPVRKTTRRRPRKQPKPEEPVPSAPLIEHRTLAGEEQEQEQEQESEDILPDPEPFGRQPLLPTDELLLAVEGVYRPVQRWRQLLALASWTPLDCPLRWPPIYQLHMQRNPPKPSLLRRAGPAIYLTAFAVVTLLSLGLLWARCQSVYLDRLSHHHSGHNGSAAGPAPGAYVCRQSFVWTYLLPRLIYLLGYLALFVSWHCLRQPELSHLLVEVTRAITATQAEYREIRATLQRQCRRNRAPLALLAAAGVVCSALDALVRTGAVMQPPPPQTPTPNRTSVSAAVLAGSTAAELVVHVVLDSMVLLVLGSYLPTVQCLRLLLLQVRQHVHSQLHQAHLSSMAYTSELYTDAHRHVRHTQVALSTALLLVLLRVSQAVVGVALDIAGDGGAGGRHVPMEGLASLPAVSLQALLTLTVVVAAGDLTRQGRAEHVRLVSTGPEFGRPPGSSSATYDGGEAPAAPPGGSGALWETSVALRRACPVVEGRLLGLTATPFWAPVVAVLLTALYCGVLYVLQRYWLLF